MQIDRRCKLFLQHRDIREPSGFSACTHGLATSNSFGFKPLAPKPIKLLGRMTEECHRKRRLFLHYRDIKGPSDFSACTHGHIQFHAGPHLVPKDMPKELEQDCSFPEPAAAAALIFFVHLCLLKEVPRN